MTSAPAVPSPQLTLVIPVHDEVGGIVPLLRHWVTVLGRLGIDHELRVYDDGSRDGSGDALAALAAELPQLVLTRHANRGHGPTILRGYREARGAWVFQADGDGEIAPGELARLWELRDRHDLVLGRRTGRRSTPDRRLVSAVSRLAVRLLFGRGVGDVNTPFRLMRAERLREALAELPEPDLFAPNVALAGLAIRRGWRIAEVPVAFESRRWGRASLGSWRLWRAAARALRETWVVARGRPAR